MAPVVQAGRVGTGGGGTTCDVHVEGLLVMCMWRDYL